MEKQLKDIDFELSCQLAGNNRKIAWELLELIMERLPEEFEEIIKAHQQNQYKQLYEAAHKLHGAISYVGVPRFKQGICDLELSIKENKTADLEEKIKNLQLAYQDLQKAYAELSLSEQESKEQ